MDGRFNTAVSQRALFGNISGQENMAVGFVALTKSWRESVLNRSR
jgi:hypothetical protein